MTPPLNAAEIAVLKDLSKPPRARRSPWVPVDDGTALVWAGAPDSREPMKWIRRLTEKYLAPKNRRKGARNRPRTVKGGQLEGFTFDHVCEGSVFVVEPVYPKFWNLIVKDNNRFYTTYSAPTKGLPKSFNKKTDGALLGAALELLSSNPTQGLKDLSSFLAVVTQVKEPGELDDLLYFLENFTDAQPPKLKKRLKAFHAREKKKIDRLVRLYYAE